MLPFYAAVLSLACVVSAAADSSSKANKCWAGDMTYATCCDEKTYGRFGNLLCWGNDERGVTYDFHNCCAPPCATGSSIDESACWAYNNMSTSMLERLFSWRQSSEGSQDAVFSFILSLIQPRSCFLVEIGSTHDVSRGSNVGWLEQSKWPTCVCGAEGWRTLRFDDADENPQINLHKEFVTKNNILDIFTRYNVPYDVDLVSIDIDSCDIYLFWELTRKWRPRVVAIEYNSRYDLGQSVAVDCFSDPPYHWRIGGFKDDVYGASLRAIFDAAELRGYAVVWVVSKLDVILVRKDLICEGHAIETVEALSQAFGSKVRLPMHTRAPPEFELKWTVDFSAWLDNQQRHVL
eukprot:TRINITY_DN67351_c0_g1_i1.p1 TRINITY_DN67351_c0_g1~~TRINITY_DN67351_c0_g1_i1.p1  ORF type:complete len:349 (+),score=29.20 TRINITY_DN67351_c0_g1_i1:91-1137(+)